MDRNTKHLTVKELKDFLSLFPDDTLLVKGNTSAWDDTKLRYVTEASFQRFFTVCDPKNKDWKISDGSLHSEVVPLDNPALMIFDARRCDY